MKERRRKREKKRVKVNHGVVKRKENENRKKR